MISYLLINKGDTAGTHRTNSPSWRLRVANAGNTNIIRSADVSANNWDKLEMEFYWNGDQLTKEIPVRADGTPENKNAIRWIYVPGSFTPLARYEKGR